MDMSVRCAVCGSKNVVKEFKKEGYDITKGVVGTALLGIPGALAGAGGKDVTYYHCADCGQVMNRPMYKVTSDWIDKLLENPDMWKEALKSEKAKYKNIEWQEDGEKLYTNQENSIENDKERKIQYYSELIIKKLQETPYIERAILQDIDECHESLDACIHLLNSGRIAQELMNGKYYYRLVTDQKEMRELFIRQNTFNYMWDIIGKDVITFRQKLFEKIECNKCYSREEFLSVLRDVFGNSFDFNEPYSLEEFCKVLLIKLQDYTTSTGNIVKFKTEEEVLKEKNEEEDAEKKVHEHTKQLLLDFLSQHLKYYPVIDMMKESEVLSEYSSITLSCRLKELVKEGRVAYKIEKKRDYYATLGIEKILEEQRRIQNEKIENELKEEEEKYNQKLETLKKQLSEQEAIFEANKSKIFGAGAKAKKEAKQRIEYFSSEIQRLKSNYMLKKSSLQNELKKI